MQIEKGIIHAQIQGSSLYKGHIHITPVKASVWKSIKAECAGKIDSMVELLQGKFSASVMGVMTRKDGGLFPKPAEIKMDCSCPDWAELCKHLAAVLYGVGSRLDSQPELLFLLRGVEPHELISAATQAPAVTVRGGSTLDTNLSEIFGIEIAQKKEPTKRNSERKKSLRVQKPSKKAQPVRRKRRRNSVKGRF